MAKFMIEASYTAEGLKGLLKDKASGRRESIAKATESMGGKLEALYYCLGDQDVVVIVDLPDIAAVTALCVTVGASGLVRPKTRQLLTVDETDKALAKSPAYRPPGR